MDENSDLEIIFLGQTPPAKHSSVTMSISEHSSTTSSTTSSIRVIKRKSTSSNEATNGPKVMRLNTTGESDLTVSTHEIQMEFANKEKPSLIEQLQKECADKENQLKSNADVINKLRSEINDKNKHLFGAKYLVDALKVECDNRDTRLKKLNKQLKANEKTIHELQMEFAKKEKQLVEKSSLIEQLQNECADKENQLAVKANAIKKLQLDLESKSAQLIEKEHLVDELQAKLNSISKSQAQLNNNDQQLIDKEFSTNESQIECISEQPNAIDKPQPNFNDEETQPNVKKSLPKPLQAECIEKVSQMEPTSYSLKFFEYSNNESFSNLEVQAKKYVDQRQYSNALIILKKAIELEKSTQNRADKLKHLFLEKVVCHLELEQYQQALKIVNSSFQQDSNDIIVLYNRATVYLELQKYSKARQDLKKLLAMRLRNIYATNLLARV